MNNLNLGTESIWISFMMIFEKWSQIIQITKSRLLWKSRIVPKISFDRHNLYMLLRKLNPKNFDDHINEDKFLTLRLCQPSLWSSNKILISFFIIHWLRQAISQNLNVDVLNLAKLKIPKCLQTSKSKTLIPKSSFKDRY